MRTAGALRTTNVVTLIVRRTIRASPERLFQAWTEPEHLVRWWGPAGIQCVGAEVDLRVGGRYRIGNRLPDGRTLWIAGEFELIERPNRLRYTWRLEGADQTPEHVTVRFQPVGEDTDVVVTHERIATPAIRDEHERGWTGCLEGLERYVAGAVA